VRVRAALALAVLLGCGPAADPAAARPASIDLAAAASPSRWEPIAGDDGIARRRDPRTGIAFVRVPAGAYTRGGLAEIDSPRHRVRIGAPFWLAATEVTVGQWRTYVLRDGGPRGTLPPAGTDPDLPVGGVSLHEATAFCTTYGYRLPTEAEWEHACRAGREGPGLARAAVLAEAWTYLNAGDRARAVGTRPANPFGLHDMLGNLWEWTADGFLPRYLVADPAAELTDPSVPAGQGPAVIRGGSWFSVPLPWPSDRMFGEPDLRTPLVGLRVARSAAD
jgi:formylglycine-generating enzyme required for sulfatase activity